MFYETYSKHFDVRLIDNETENRLDSPRKGKQCDQACVSVKDVSEAAATAHMFSEVIMHESVTTTD